MKSLRLLAIGAMALTAMLAVPAAAGATTTVDAPPNDNFAGAITLTKPSTHFTDTSAAGRSADDERAEAACSWWTPITVNNSVWYTYTAKPGGENIRLSTAGSGYNAQIAVFSGFDDPTYGAYPWSCGKSIMDLELVPENGPYTIVVYQPTAGAGGGNLQLNVSESPDLEAPVEVNYAAKRSADGKQVQLSGRLECNQGCLTNISLQVTQNGVVATGATSEELPVPGKRKWAATAEVAKGTLRPGGAVVKVTVQSMSATDTTSYSYSMPIRIDG